MKNKNSDSTNEELEENPTPHSIKKFKISPSGTPSKEQNEDNEEELETEVEEKKPRFDLIFSNLFIVGKRRKARPSTSLWLRVIIQRMSSRLSCSGRIGRRSRLMGTCMMNPILFGSLLISLIRYSWFYQLEIKFWDLLMLLADVSHVGIWKNRFLTSQRKENGC